MLVGSVQDSLFVRLHTLVQFDDVAADEPDQVAEIRDGSLVPDIVQHVLVVHCENKGLASSSPGRWKCTLMHKPWAPRRIYQRGRVRKEEK